MTISDGTNEMPAVKEKMDNIESLYANIKTAIYDTLNEISPITDSPRRLV